jgi:RNA polymerase-binding protein DksA
MYVLFFLIGYFIRRDSVKDYELQYLSNKLHAKMEKQRSSYIQHKELGIANSLKETSNELSTYDNHPADLGSETYELGRQLALDRHQDKQMKEVQVALERIEKGTYGYCESCGKAIEFQRLDAIPETSLCLECEEEKTNFHRTVNKKDLEIFDEADALQNTQKYGSSSGPQDIGDDDMLDYGDTWYENHETPGYMDDIENISNQVYRDQLPDYHGNSIDGYVDTDKESKIHYFGEEESEYEGI